MSRNAVKSLSAAINDVIEYHQSEFRMTTAEAIGALEIIKMYLFKRVIDAMDIEEDGHE